MNLIAGALGATGSGTVTVNLQQRDTLIEKHLNLCQQLVSCLLRQRGHVGIEREDLISEAHIGLIRAAESFDEKRGASFKTHAKHCIINALKDAVRQVRGVEIQVADFEALEDHEGQSAPDQGFAQVENRLFIEQALSQLTPRQAEAVRLHYLEDLTHNVVAARMNISKRRVMSLCADALVKMREFAAA
jgi:RNA polymerase sigma factor (sigma-70 family)